MNSIKDLKRTSPEDPRSLSSLNNQPVVEEPKDETPSTPIININGRRNLNRNRSEDAQRLNNIKPVNPDDYIEKPKAPQGETIQGRAMNLLAQAVERKQQEYRQFVQQALEDDEINRSQVEAGIETIDGELQYLPDELHEPMAEDEKIQVLDQSDNEPEDQIKLFNEEDDFEYEDMDEPNSDVEISHTTITNIFDQDSDEVNDQSDVEPVKSAPKENNEVLASIINPSVEEIAVEETTQTDFEIDDEDLEDLEQPSDITEDIKEEDIEEELSEDEISDIRIKQTKRFRSEILQKVINTATVSNTSKFAVSTKVINIKDILHNKPFHKTVRTAIWPLLFTGRPYKASALKGSELAFLGESGDQKTFSGVTKDHLKVLFEHDVNQYRPNTIEKWAKTISFLDLDSIFIALYRASLKDANYIPRVCPKPSCQYSYLSDDISINDIIHFEDDETKKLFERIQQQELTPENSGTYESMINIINSKFAVGVKFPSLYSTIYEYGSLSKEFIDKYRELLSTIYYIDYLYYIDEDNSQFQPIGWKTYPGDPNKSFKSKVATYAKILGEFDDTDFMVLMSTVQSVINNAVESKSISYVIPETKCPKCNTVIPKVEVDARELLFMRQQLVELATMPLKK